MCFARLAVNRKACRSSWQIDIDQAMLTFGDPTLPELRRQVRCPQCNSPITTTLISLK